jgi:phosphate transport system permease protein
LRRGDGAVVQRKPGGNLLRVKAQIDFRGGVALPAEAGPVVACSYAFTEERGAGAAVAADGKPRFVRESAADGEPAGRRTFTLAEPMERGPEAPPSLAFALVDEEVRTAWFADREGAVLRVGLTAERPERLEVKATATPTGPPAGLAAFEFVLGDRSLALGTRGGELEIWSLVSNADGTGSTDGRALRRFHAFPRFGAGVACLVSAPTRRTLYVGLADGRIATTYPTNERVVTETSAFPGPIALIAPAWKDDGVLVVGPGSGYKAFDLDNPHPETNARALFGEVHYEGYDRGTYAYQSSSSTDESEPKLSLTPLVFGTLKAVFYAMLFALPLALLAALYVSQFMHPKVRAFVKPGIEVMASLPSVVLGFLAALVIAPAVAEIVPSVFATLFGIAAVAFVAGIAWQGLPIETRQSIPSGVRLLIAAVLVALVAATAVGSAGLVGRALFSGAANPMGDFRIWLSGAGRTGEGLPLLRVALAVLGAGLGFAFVPRRLPLARLAGVPRALARLGCWVVAPALLLALLAPLIEHKVFADSFRFFLVGKGPGQGTVFDVRNSLVVGIAMGFAVIPVVFTIAEDALSSIPDSLRSAALGCGASPWQTATRVVVPAAIPGLFSAAMIGLGRAVGETMIVLMATGGTAIIDGSIFNGFRTLSANIATELPEAPVGGTLYRVLFLAGLLLFALTFVLNTVAEMVRLRFRRKFRGL